MFAPRLACPAGRYQQRKGIEVNAKQKRVWNIIKRGLKYHGVNDDLGVGGSLSENLIADLQEAGFSIVDRNGNTVWESV